MRGVILLLFAFNVMCFGSNQEWISQAENNVSLDAVKWLKDGMKEELRYKYAKGKRNDLQSNQKCFSNNTSTLEPKLFVFMSFSVPDETWVALSKDLTIAEGTFILRGLPNNSFVELAKKISSLKKNGVKAQIQLNPILFSKYNVMKVPAFGIYENEDFEILSGNISLDCALDILADKGKSKNARILLEKIKETRVKDL